MTIGVVWWNITSISERSAAMFRLETSIFLSLFIINSQMRQFSVVDSTLKKLI
jgi:hypothetical protein